MSRRGPLPPLTGRMTKLRLLAWSYPDAVVSKVGAGETTGSRLESAMPSRNGELWTYGSYEPYEDAVARMTAPLRQELARLERDWKDDRILGGALQKLSELMPDTLFVPTQISEAAGYLLADAKAAATRFEVAILRLDEVRPTASVTS